ncbi:MAG: transglycosylase SLT domain-containing protein [Proteobacteria bacterium]|nr:transglycosylase SLT domain-containing protein [Pseudomonadota bacterium]
MTKILFILIFVLFSNPTFADIYKYEDEQGVIHFTDTPTHSGFKLYLRTGFFNVKDYKDYFKKYDHIIFKYSKEFGVEYPLVKAVIRAESGYNPKAVSPKGAMGLMQLMPETASLFECENPFDPESNIRTGIKYLSYLLNYFKGNMDLALAAYNAGPKNVIKYNYSIPPFNETRMYVRKVKEFYRFYSQEASKIN